MDLPPPDDDWQTRLGDLIEVDSPSDRRQLELFLEGGGKHPLGCADPELWSASLAVYQTLLALRLEPADGLFALQNMTYTDPRLEMARRCLSASAGLVREVGAAPRGHERRWFRRARAPGGGVSQATAFGALVEATDLVVAATNLVTATRAEPRVLPPQLRPINLRKLKGQLDLLVAQTQHQDARRQLQAAWELLLQTQPLHGIDGSEWTRLLQAAEAYVASCLEVHLAQNNATSCQGTCAVDLVAAAALASLHLCRAFEHGRRAHNSATPSALDEVARALLFINLPAREGGLTAGTPPFPSLDACAEAVLSFLASLVTSALADNPKRLAEAAHVLDDLAASERQATRITSDTRVPAIEDVPLAQGHSFLRAARDACARPRVVELAALDNPAIPSGQLGATRRALPEEDEGEENANSSARATDPPRRNAAFFHF